MTSAEAWATAFEEGFKLVDESIMGRVRYRLAAPIDATRIAVVYDDWEGALAGRVYELRLLEELDFDRRQRIQTAMGIVIGELIEPSGGGKSRDSTVLKSINSMYPGIQWFGDVP